MVSHGESWCGDISQSWQLAVAHFHSSDPHAAPSTSPHPPPISSQGKHPSHVHAQCPCRTCLCDVVSVMLCLCDVVSMCCVCAVCVCVCPVCDCVCVQCACRVFGVMSSIATFAFAYGGHNIALEIQSTLPMPPSTVGPMMKSVHAAFIPTGGYQGSGVLGF